MRILVTGGAGFVGTNLIKQLLRRGYEVVCVDNYHTGLEQNHQLGAQYVKFDIRNIYDYSVWGKFDTVYHLAAIARIQPSFKQPEDYFSTNANGTMNVVKYCTENNIPLVYAGSSSHHSGKFKNPYTFSKDIGEEIVQLFQIHYNLKASIVRFYNVYGPSQLTEGSYTTLIGRWIDRKEKNLPLIIYGNGSKRRDFTHVDDIVQGLLLVMEKEAWGEVFELGKGKNYSILEVANMFNHPYLFEEDKPGEAISTLSDASLARLKLGWQPVKELEDYLKSF